MYYEKAHVKRYERKDRKGANTHINLGVNSQFQNKDAVIIIKEELFQELEQEHKSEPTPEIDVGKYEEEIQKLETENEKLKEEISQNDTRQFEEDIERLETENKKLKDEIAKNDTSKFEDEISQLKNENEKLKKEIEQLDDLPKIVKLQEKHKEEVLDLSYRLSNEKDFSKALLVAMNDLNKRSFFDRLRNKEPESVKIVTELKALETKSNNEPEE